MADTKISALTAVTAAAGSNELGTNESGTSKKVSLTQVQTLFQTVGMSRVFSMSSDHAISSTTGTEVTQLGTITLEAGTYTFRYYLIMQSATTTVGLSLGVNFTGTAAVRAMLLRYPSTGVAAATGVADDAGVIGGQIHESNPQTAYSTTAPNMAFTGVATINTNILGVIEGVLVVTATGDLELWHASETATSTTLKAGSSLIVTRVA